MAPALTERLSKFVESQQLPDSFQNIVGTYYLPLAEWLYQQCSLRLKDSLNDCPVLGINGAQGTGKSTLSAVLKIILEENHDWQTAILSLDDIYLPRAERETLGRVVHPLLQTRGVPGTHDTALGNDIMKQLKALKPGQTLLLPRFDKALDDRKPKTEWEAFTGPTDLIIFEGWCLGSTPMNPDDLTTAINSLEAEEDPNAVWRNYINHHLQGHYRVLFAQTDLLVMLKAPDFDSIRRWRFEQEEKLAANLISPDARNTGANKIMDKSALIRFIQHYQRLTQHNLEEMPNRADVVLNLDSHHQVTEMRYKTSPGNHQTQP